jgi:hypothetical protein
MSAFLADLIVVFHFAFVVFCVVGELSILLGAICKWKWVRNVTFRIIHVCAVLYVAGEAAVGVDCPLTDWEYILRSSAGQQHDESMSFVARIIRRLIFYDFPPVFFTVLYIGFGALVLLTFILVRPHRRSKNDGLR